MSEKVLLIETAEAVLRLSEYFAEFCRRRGAGDNDLEAGALFHAARIKHRLDRMGISTTPYWSPPTAKDHNP